MGTDDEEINQTPPYNDDYLEVEIDLMDDDSTKILVSTFDSQKIHHSPKKIKAKRKHSINPNSNLTISQIKKRGENKISEVKS